jgi:hypothetical protein
LHNKWARCFTWQYNNNMHFSSLILNTHLSYYEFVKDPIENKLKDFHGLSLVDNYQHLVKYHLIIQF